MGCTGNVMKRSSIRSQPIDFNDDWYVFCICTYIGCHSQWMKTSQGEPTHKIRISSQQFSLSTISAARCLENEYYLFYPTLSKFQAHAIDIDSRHVHTVNTFHLANNLVKNRNQSIEKIKIDLKEKFNNNPSFVIIISRRIFLPNSR